MWLLQQLDRSRQHEPGFTVGDQIVIATGQADVTVGRQEVYGKSNGRCQQCPHLAGAWLGFLLSRVLDLLVVGAIALLWVLYGWLSQSAAATAFVQMKHQRMVALKMRDSIFGTMLSTKGGLMMTPSLARALSGHEGGNSNAAMSKEMQREMRHHISAQHQQESAARQTGGVAVGRSDTFSREMQREMRRHLSGQQREHAARQHSGGLPYEHIPLQIQSSVSQPAAGPPAVMEAPNGSRVVPAAANIGPSYASAFSLVEQPSVQHMLASEPSTSSLQATASRAHSGGLYHIYRPPSMRWSSAVGVVNLLKQHYMGGAPQVMAQQGLDDDVLGQQAALMLMAVKHLACLAQVSTPRNAAALLKQAC
jgi:hypothetical protein